MNDSSVSISLERSSDLSTVFNLQAAHRELVICVLPLILSMRLLKRSIVGKPVQFHGSIQIPHSNIHWKAPAVRGNTLYSTRIPFKSKLSGICYGKYTAVFIIILLITTYDTDTFLSPI